ncbi:DUF2149 domain-containing protein [Shewanella youngdeokensis]|uniref:DUF2149 domain-containing protein n=1 Tax=Shewanella youngdeokensis TaxID=2999068 RepID=A0ABZ0JXJ9_9GAMM|nr:DUF2149 domain-containing protein [Shewanella sp. DAU334]
MKLLDEDEELNPMLSVTNLIDVFLVVIAALLITIAQNPLNPLTDDKVTVIKNAGTAEMSVTIKDGDTITEYKSTGEIGSGGGSRAGVAYQMADGSFVYVPDDAANNDSKSEQL